MKRLAIVAVAAAVAGCDTTEPTVCNLIGLPAIIATVLLPDSTPAFGATVVAVSRGLRDTAIVEAPDSTVGLAQEFPGHFTVSASLSGVGAAKTIVSVGRDACHVQTRRITLVLQ